MKRKLLYIIDNINYIGGVPKATAQQANKLIEDFEISVFSLEQPNDDTRSLFLAANFIAIEDSFFKTLTISFANVMKARDIRLKHKLLRIIFSVSIRLGVSDMLVNIMLRKKFYETFNSFDVVCVAGHDSFFRELVASLSKPKKIQWIHIDYCLWSNYDSRSKALSKNDLSRYLRFHTIVCLTEGIRQGLIKKMPQLNAKAVVMPNFVDVEFLKKSANMPIDTSVDSSLLNLITLNRLAPEKKIEGILKLSAYLAEKGYRFKWYIVGGGVLWDYAQKLIEEYRLKEYVVMTGYMKNPYPLINACDIFVLLSLMEGVPASIDEALTIGIPVIATDVGGIRNQINHGINGLLLRNDEECIKEAFDYIFQNKEVLHKLKANAKLGAEAAVDRNSEILEKVRDVFLSKK